MRRFWLWFWITVLISLMLTIWIQVRYFRGPVPAISTVNPGLLELAEATVQEWNEILPVEPDGKELSGENPQMDREEWLLRLRDAEAMATSRGVEVAIAEDLRHWMFSAANQTTSADEGLNLLSYMHGLLRWIQPDAEMPSGFELERLSLHPEPSSSFPSLVFEMQGKPDAMGEYLWNQITGLKGWEVREIDLNQGSAARGWWMRGSCAFMTQGKQ